MHVLRYTTVLTVRACIMIQHLQALEERESEVSYTVTCIQLLYYSVFSVLCSWEFVTGLR